MDAAHLHLTITHLPIFGIFLGMVVLIYGLLSKSEATVGAAYLVFILSSIGGGIAYFTGEYAEELVEHIIGVAERNIKLHEESAEITIIVLTVLGVTAFVSLILNYRLKKYHNELAVLTLLIAMISLSLAARTAYLGGQIRHTEISTEQQRLNPKSTSMLQLTGFN